MHSHHSEIPWSALAHRVSEGNYFSLKSTLLSATFFLLFPAGPFLARSGRSSLAPTCFDFRIWSFTSKRPLRCKAV